MVMNVGWQHHNDSTMLCKHSNLWSTCSMPQKSPAPGCVEDRDVLSFQSLQWSIAISYSSCSLSLFVHVPLILWICVFVFPVLILAWGKLDFTLLLLRCYMIFRDITSICPTFSARKSLNVWKTCLRTLGAPGPQVVTATAQLSEFLVSWPNLPPSAYSSGAQLGVLWTTS